jgi:hypothetical protein
MDDIFLFFDELLLSGLGTCSSSLLFSFSLYNEASAGAQGRSLIEL